MTSSYGTRPIHSHGVLHDPFIFDMTHWASKILNHMWHDLFTYLHPAFCFPQTGPATSSWAESTRARVMTLSWMGHVTHVNVSWHTHERVASHIWTGYVTHLNESRRTDERVTPHTWKRHAMSHRGLSLGHVAQTFTFTITKTSNLTHSFPPALGNIVSHFCTLERHTGSVWAHFSSLHKIRELTDLFRPAQGYEHKWFTPYTGKPIFRYGLSWKIQADSAWRKSVSQQACFQRLLTHIVDTI